MRPLCFIFALFLALPALGKEDGIVTGNCLESARAAS